MSRGLICVFLFSALFAVAFGEFRLIRGPANFHNESSCVAQNGNKYYNGWVQTSEDAQRESVIYSLNFTSGKTERVFPDFTDRVRQWMSKFGQSLGGWTTEHMGFPTLICAGNKLFIELTLENDGPSGGKFTREHRTHIILDLDLDISPAQIRS